MKLLETIQERDREFQAVWNYSRRLRMSFYALVTVEVTFLVIALWPREPDLKVGLSSLSAAVSTAYLQSILPAMAVGAMIWIAGLSIGFYRRDRKRLLDMR